MRSPPRVRENECLLRPRQVIPLHYVRWVNPTTVGTGPSLLQRVHPRHVRFAICPDLRASPALIGSIPSGVVRPLAGATVRLIPSALSREGGDGELLAATPASSP